MKCDCRDLRKSDVLTTEKCFKDMWIFDELDKDQLKKVECVGLNRSIKKGTLVFMQGECANEMFLIKYGRIKLYKIHEDGSEAILDFRKAGDIIGENIFSGEADYPLSAWALEDTVICGFNINSFNELMIKHPDIGLSVIRSMSNKISSITDRLDNMSEKSLDQRLYNVLLNVAKDHGTKGSKGMALKFSLTHEELGFLASAHRVSITKAMKSLIDCGKIIKNGKVLILT